MTEKVKRDTGTYKCDTSAIVLGNCVATVGKGGTKHGGVNIRAKVKSYSVNLF